MNKNFNNKIEQNLHNFEDVICEEVKKQYGCPMETKEVFTCVECLYFLSKQIFASNKKRIEKIEKTMR
jgi:hypothetical protein